MQYFTVVDPVNSPFNNYSAFEHHECINCYETSLSVNWEYWLVMLVFEIQLQSLDLILLFLIKE